MQRPTAVGLSVVAISTLVLATSCSSSGGSSSTSSGLTEAYPSGLAVSSPTAQGTAAFAESTSSNPSAQAVDSTKNYSEKKAAIESVLNATSAASCAIDVSLLSPTNANCYGPSMTYVNHPETLQGGGAINSAPGGDLGIWSATDTGGEACAATQLNSRVKGMASQVDAGMFSMASLLCVAKNTGESLPSEGGSVDLTTSMSGKIKINGSDLTVTSATLTREANSGEGHKVYTSNIVGTTGTRTITMRLKHVATGADNATYKGKLSLKIANADGTKPGNCGAGTATGQTDAVSIAYEKSSASNITYQLKSANFCGDSADPYVSGTDFSVDLYNKTFSSGSRPNGWANNANYSIAQLNPVTATGTLLYAWQAGALDSHTRAFNAKIDSNGNSGVAYFGFGPHMQASSTYAATGSISGMICNWIKMDGHTLQTTVQKQTITRTGGKFVPAASKITYDPVVSCSSNDASFQMTPSGGSAVTADTTVTDLENLSDVSANITAPTAPANVDL